jgi:O-antigen/teichoic acid export membrane protein
MMAEADTVTNGERASHGILKKCSYLLSARWVREVLQAVFLIYLARTHTTTYGEFMLAISFGYILLFVAEFGLNQHLATLLARKTGDPGAMLVQVTFLKAMLLGCAWLGLFGFIRWQGYDPRLQRVVLVIGTGLGLEALASSFFVSCQVQGRQDVEGRLRSLAAVAGFGYGLLAIFLGAPAIVVAFFKLVETFVNLGGSMRVAFKQMRFNLHLHQVGIIWKTWRGSIVYTLIAVAAILYNKINIFFLQRFAGAEGVAQYSATWHIVDGVSCLVSVVLLRKVLFPLFLKLAATDPDEFHVLARNSARWLFALAVPVMFILFIESDRLIPLIYGAGFADAVWMQRYLVITILFAFLHNVAVYAMISVHRQKLLLCFFVLGLLFNLAMCLAIIPRAPLGGPALVFVLYKGALAAMTVTYCQRHLDLLPGRHLRALAAAMLAGCVLYFAGRAWISREAAEILAVLPTLFLVWRWWQDLRRERREAGHA